MTISSKYIVTSDADTYFVDKNSGTPLTQGTLKFYRDSARNVPKNVFQLTGTDPTYSYTSMGSTLTLSNAGTVVNSVNDDVVIYYYPYILNPSTGKEEVDRYYIEARDQNGNLQWTREAWPNIADDTSTITETKNFENQISNYQFSNVFVQDDIYTQYTVSSAVNQLLPVAPNWYIVASGTGTISVRRNVIAGITQLKTSPPYDLEIILGAGVTNVKLTQRFYKNSGLWASTSGNNVYLSASFMARSISASPQNLTMYYTESNPLYTPVPIVSGSFNSVYTFIEGGTSSQIPSSIDSISGSDAYVDIYLALDENAHISVTSINLVPVLSETQKIGYSFNSSNRDQSYQGDYYTPRLSEKRQSSFLTGWDFQMNPFQFGEAKLNVGTNPFYIADQTIFKTSASVVHFSRDVATKGLYISRFPGAGGPFCVLQYLKGNIVKEIVNNRLSCMINAYKTNSVVDVLMRVYLFRAPSSALFPNLATNNIIGVLNPDGSFSLTEAGWTEIPRSGMPTAVAQLKILLSSNQIINQNYGFNGWQETDETKISDSDKFAIVVTFSDPGVSSHVTINSISLVPGDVPCQGSYLPPDETLRQCQYYYRKSPPGSVTPSSYVSGSPLLDYATFGIQPSSGANSTGPCVLFDSDMVTTPNISLFNPSASNNEIRNVTAGSNWSSSASIYTTTRGFKTTGTATGAAANLVAVIWEADARIGLTLLT